MPAQQTEHSPSTQHAHDGLASARRFTELLDQRIGELDDAKAHAPSRLPGWTRGHVITHLARNADGLANLLTWARTGVEHPMYASAADREADIEEGAPRLAKVLHEDFAAASRRLHSAADELPASAWDAVVSNPLGTFPAHVVPWLRLVEVSIHLVDLDVGADFDDVAGLLGARLMPLLDLVLVRYHGRDDVPAVSLEVRLPDGETQRRDFGSSGDSVTVTGDAGAALAWLTGRTAGGDLHGPTPTLPAWL